jgi:hypothetical protein
MHNSAWSVAHPPIALEPQQTLLKTIYGTKAGITLGWLFFLAPL